MKRMFKVGVSSAALVGAMALSGSAAAQGMSLEADTEGGGGMGLPGGAPARAAAGDSDHDAMIGRLGFGYMGRFQIPFPGGDLSAPAIGIRYWIDQMIGLDLGLGLISTAVSSKNINGPVTTTVDDASVFGTIIHAGVPLSLASGRHFSFQIVPELNIGFATSTEEVPNGNGREINLQGFGVDVGARIGGEVHFGFIGIPELSIQGNVGLLFATRSTKTSATGGNQPEVTAERTDTIITTTVYDDPFKLFTSNVAVLYYF